jgi:hypothetical protein
MRRAYINACLGVTPWSSAALHDRIEPRRDASMAGKSAWQTGLPGGPGGSVLNRRCISGPTMRLYSRFADSALPSCVELACGHQKAARRR